MGCDVHCCVEVYIDGQWHTWSQPKVWRDYSLFTKMANVRGHCENPVAEDRGIPEDVSIVTRLAMDWSGDHSESWMTRQEMDEVRDWYYKKTEGKNEEVFGDPPACSNWNDLPHGIQNIRLVFAFDS